MTTREKIIVEAVAHNNTLAWEHEGNIYIDSMKYPRAMMNHIYEATGVMGYIMVGNEDIGHNAEILFGIKSSGIVVGGRETNCFVIKYAKEDLY
jgi:hypothetical protein